MPKARKAQAPEVARWVQEGFREIQKGNLLTKGKIGLKSQGKICREI